jgi:hypothetical protein
VGLSARSILLVCCLCGGLASAANHWSGAHDPCTRSVAALAEAILHEPSDTEKLVVLSHAIDGKEVYTCQAAALLPLFGFTENMLEALRRFAPRLVDRENRAGLLRLFRTSEALEQARRVLEI